MSVKPECRLRVRRIRPQTLIQYSDHVHEFYTWCKQRRKSVSSQRQVDIAMAAYFNLSFEDGASQNVASYTLFGWIALKCVPVGPERDQLPLSRAALTAWRGSTPSKARVGVPPQVICSFALYCCTCRPDQQKFWLCMVLILSRLWLDWLLTGVCFLAIPIFQSQPKPGPMMMWCSQIPSTGPWCLRSFNTFPKWLSSQTTWCFRNWPFPDTSNCLGISPNITGWKRLFSLHMSFATADLALMSCMGIEICPQCKRVVGGPVSAPFLVTKARSFVVAC